MKKSAALSSSLQKARTSRSPSTLYDLSIDAPIQGVLLWCKHRSLCVHLMCLIQKTKRCHLGFIFILRAQSACPLHLYFATKVMFFKFVVLSVLKLCRRQIHYQYTLSQKACHYRSKNTIKCCQRQIWEKTLHKIGFSFIAS